MRICCNKWKSVKAKYSPGLPWNALLLVVDRHQGYALDISVVRTNSNGQIVDNDQDIIPTHYLEISKICTPDSRRCDDAGIPRSSWIKIVLFLSFVGLLAHAASVGLKSYLYTNVINVSGTNVMDIVKEFKKV